MLVDQELIQERSKRIAKETQRRDRLASSNIIEHPSRYDVLLGRGKPYQDFPGNLRLNHMVDLRGKDL